VKRDADGNWGYQVDFAETQYEGWPVSTAGEAFSQLAAFLSTNFYAFLPYGTQPTAAGTGPANPAAAYCLAQGGALDLRTDEHGGQYSVCMFPDGREVEAWAFYRGEAEPELPGPGLQSLPAPSGEYQIGVGRRTPGKQRFAYLRARGMR
jgi:putative hemolysin